MSKLTPSDQQIRQGSGTLWMFHPSQFFKEGFRNSTLKRSLQFDLTLGSGGKGETVRTEWKTYLDALHTGVLRKRLCRW
jgi:hypothetical protein